MNKSKQEFVEELNQQFVEYKEWMLEMPRRVTALELVQRKNPLFFRETKVIETEEDWVYYLVKTQRVKGLTLTTNGWRLKVEVDVHESAVYKNPVSGNEIVSGNPVGRNWNECSMYIHYLEIGDEEVSTLRNNFPELWEKLQ